MSNMEAQMRERMAADGGAGLPPDPSGPAPGNEGRQPDPAAPPAGESNADNAGGQGTPDTIPYARFKEVNDRYAELRPFEELTQYGYDADSLRRLAAFETGYMQDPVGTVKLMAENLDLPQEIISALDAHIASASGGDGRAEGEPDASGQKPADLPPEVQQRLEYVDQLRAREEEQAREAQLQAVVQAWDRLDEQEKITTPEEIKLMAIASAAGSGQRFNTYEELAQLARSTINKFRGDVLGSAVQGTGRGGTPPPSLPSTGPAGTPPVKFDSMRAASRAAEAAIARGELPPLQP